MNSYCSRDGIVIVHPLLRRDEEYVTDQQKLVPDTLSSRVGIQVVSFSDLYELDRQPLAVPLQMW